MSAQIITEDIYYPTIGKPSLHDHSHDNGQRLIKFAASRRMIIVSILFSHNKLHKGTWKATERQTVNQIDHILIDVRHKSDLIDVRSLRGANIASDHFLVLSKFRARISNCKKKVELKSRIMALKS
jgi:endonuclease/exonuclease/phosphatase family metal-dependent hydrolase